MTVSRASQVDPTTTPYYHVMSRCVRRAFLCGVDRYSGRDYGHRKQWLVARLRTLGSVFAVEVCAYAVMSNHYHLVLRLTPDRAQAWTEDEVVERYGKLFSNAKAQLKLLTDPERRAARLALWRERLSSISWMMRTLNEYIARQANKEDEVTGRFWEGRFKSQPLLDEAALLTCMSYVDLNPVRAGAAKRLDDAEFTSIHERLAAMGARLDEAESVSAETPGAEAGAAGVGTRLELDPAAASPAAADDAGADSPTTTSLRETATTSDAATERATNHAESATAAPEGTSSPRPHTEHLLVPFADEPNPTSTEALPMTTADYVALLDWTGRAVRKGSASLAGPLPSLLVRRGIDPEAWQRLMAGSGLRSFGTVGTRASLEAEAARTSRAWIRGQAIAKRLFDDEAVDVRFRAA